MNRPDIDSLARRIKTADAHSGDYATHFIEVGTE